MFLYLTPRLSEASQSRSLYRLICISKRQSFPVCGQADLFRANSTRFIAVMCRIQSLSVCLWISFRYLSGVPLAASGSERQPSGSFTAAMFRLGTPIKMHVQFPKFVIYILGCQCLWAVILTHHFAAHLSYAIPAALREQPYVSVMVAAEGTRWGALFASLGVWWPNEWNWTTLEFTWTMMLEVKIAITMLSSRSVAYLVPFLSNHFEHRRSDKHQHLKVKGTSYRTITHNKHCIQLFEDLTSYITCAIKSQARSTILVEPQFPKLADWRCAVTQENY